MDVWKAERAQIPLSEPWPEARAAVRSRPLVKYDKSVSDVISPDTSLTLLHLHDAPKGPQPQGMGADPGPPALHAASLTGVGPRGLVTSEGNRELV